MEWAGASRGRDHRGVLLSCVPWSLRAVTPRSQVPPHRFSGSQWDSPAPHLPCTRSGGRRSTAAGPDGGCVSGCQNAHTAQPHRQCGGQSCPARAAHDAVIRTSQGRTAHVRPRMPPRPCSVANYCQPRTGQDADSLGQLGVRVCGHVHPATFFLCSTPLTD